jgi:hypothetical protein
VTTKWKALTTNGFDRFDDDDDNGGLDELDREGRDDSRGREDDGVLRESDRGRREDRKD